MALLPRHNIITTDNDLKSCAQVGNDEFAFGFDFKSLLTSSDNANILPDWRWHKFSLSDGQPPVYFKDQKWPTQDSMIRYHIRNPRQKALTHWIIENRQQLNTGISDLSQKRKMEQRLK
jgi:hypothetical protein